MFNKILALGFIFAASFIVYGKSPVLGTTAYRAHRTTDAMLSALDEIDPNRR